MRRDVLFLVLTRPSLTHGVPFEAFMANVVFWMLAGVIFSGPHWYRSPFAFWLCVVPVHVILERITAWDFHGFRTLRLWLETTGIGRTDLEPYRVNVKDPSEIPSSV